MRGAAIAARTLSPQGRAGPGKHAPGGPAAAIASASRAPPARCACGAPLVWGSHFCANCGRPVAATPPVIGCARCGSALAADAKFCAVCGKEVVPERQAEDAASEPPDGLLDALPASAPERWER